MKTYRLKFKLKNHRDARPFETVVKAADDADVQGIKPDTAAVVSQAHDALQG